MIKISMTRDALIKSYTREFKYGSISMANNDQEILKNMKIGKRIELRIEIVDQDINIEETNIKGKVAIISKNNLVIAFEHTYEAIMLKNKIEKIINGNYSNNIFK